MPDEEKVAEEQYVTYQECITSLGSNPEGLTDEEAQERLDKYGPNILSLNQGENPITLFLRQFKSPLVYVLIFAAIVSILVDHTVDAVVIGLVLLINSIIGFVQEYRAERTIESIRKLIEEKSIVIREGEEYEIQSSEIVPGDILLLRAGEKVPADGRILFERNFHVDESLLTGESVAIKKDVICLVENPHYYEETNKVFAGSFVTEGRARILIEDTGDNTTLGEINKNISEVEKETNSVMVRIGRISRFFIALAMLFLVATLLLGSYRGIELVELLLFSLSAVVSAIPEGLVAIITIVLSVGVYRLSQQNVIVRNLGVLETLGNVNVICSDKTGTLTKNQMMVRRIFTPHHIYEVSGSGYEVDSGAIYLEGCGPAGCLRSPGIAAKIDSSEIEVEKEKIVGNKLEDFPDLEQLLSYLALCNDSDLYSECLSEDDPLKQCIGEERIWKIRGSPTEAALLVALEKSGVHHYILAEAWQRISEIPFSSDRKYMATLHSRSDSVSKIHPTDTEHQNLLIVKGAPERIESFLNTPSDTEEIIEEFASQGLRVLSCAAKFVPSDIEQVTDEDLRDLEFIGLCGINDPPRTGVRDYIEKSNNAGIDILMITGDNEFTAKSIGEEVGIYNASRGDSSLTGDDIDSLNDDELKQALSSGTKIMSRTSPTHKLRIVKALQELDKVVSMTGDGVNDSPALRQANVGIAMGITGTDIAKEAADIVLQDERFQVVVDGVEEGRNILNSFKRVVLFLTSTNLAESFTILLILLMSPIIPVLLLPIQILWVNLVTDGMLDVALSLEPKEEGLLDRGPSSLKDRILSKKAIGLSVFYGTIMAAIVLIVYFVNLYEDSDKLRTEIFLALIIVQWFSVQNCRSTDKSTFKMGILRNKYILAVYVIDISLVSILFLLEPLRQVFRLVPLSPMEWIPIVLATSLILIVEEIRKRIMSPKENLE